MTMQGPELRTIRKSLDMTLKQMGAALGLTEQFVGMMERGEKPIEIRTALAVRQLCSPAGAADRIDWTPIDQISTELQDGRSVLLWDHEGAAIARYDDEGDFWIVAPRGPKRTPVIVWHPTHFAALTPPVVEDLPG